jgi:hypothetical protein
MKKKRIRKDEKREVTPEFVDMSKEILYPQIQGVTPGNCCYRKTPHKAISYPIRTDLATHRLSTYLQEFDGFFRSGHLSADDKLN